jgi:hypothetical protein
VRIVSRRRYRADSARLEALEREIAELRQYIAGLRFNARKFVQDSGG